MSTFCEHAHILWVLVHVWPFLIKLLMLHGCFILFILFFCVLVDGVCRHCHGDISNCGGTARDDNCISYTQVATNAAALLATGTTVISVAKLLPLYLLRVFTHRVLEVLVAVARRPQPNAPFDPSGKSPSDIITAVSNRLIEIPEAVVFLGSLATDASSGEALRDTALAAIKVIDAMRAALPDHNGTTRNDYGKFLYIFALCQEYVQTTFSSGIASGQSPHGSSSSSKAPAAKIRTPADFACFAETLNLFVLVCAASGAALAIVTTRFIQEAVYQPLRRHNFTWMVSFELFILYLEQIDVPESLPLTFTTVLSQGGLDTFLAQASINAAARFGAKFKSGKQDIFQQQESTSDPVEKGSSNPNCGICNTYNFQGRVHGDEEHVDGVCKKRHVCNRYVNDKGKLGKCEGAHPHYECNNPARCTREEAAAL